MGPVIPSRGWNPRIVTRTVFWNHHDAMQKSSKNKIIKRIKSELWRTFLCCSNLKRNVVHFAIGSKISLPDGNWNFSAQPKNKRRRYFPFHFQTQQSSNQSALVAPWTAATASRPQQHSSIGKQTEAPMSATSNNYVRLEIRKFRQGGPHVQNQWNFIFQFFKRLQQTIHFNFFITTAKGLPVHLVRDVLSQKKQKMICVWTWPALSTIQSASHQTSGGKNHQNRTRTHICKQKMQTNRTTTQRCCLIVAVNAPSSWHTK